MIRVYDNTCFELPWNKTTFTTNSAASGPLQTTVVRCLVDGSAPPLLVFCSTQLTLTQWALNQGSAHSRSPQSPRRVGCGVGPGALKARFLSSIVHLCCLFLQGQVCNTRLMRVRCSLTSLCSRLWCWNSRSDFGICHTAFFIYVTMRFEQYHLVFGIKLRVPRPLYLWAHQADRNLDCPCSKG